MPDHTLESGLIAAAKQLIANGEYGNTIPILEKASREKRASADTFELLGFCYGQLRHFDKAIAAYRKAVAKKDRKLSAQLGLADMLAKAERIAEARAAVDAVDMDKLDLSARAWTWAAKGNVAAHDYVLDEAIGYYLKAVSAEPAMWTVWVSLGHCYTEQKRLDLAGGAYERAYALAPNFHTSFHLGVHCMLAGRWDEAWRLQEVRLQQPMFKHPFKHLPNWDGRHVETLVVSHEGGLGDLTLFARYIPLAAEKVGWLYWCVPERYFDYIASFEWPENVELVHELGNIEKPDCRASLLSMPLYLALYTPEEAPPPPICKVVRGNIKPHLQVAITWKGDPNFPNAKGRDASLEVFRQLIEVFPEVDFFTVSPGDDIGEEIRRTKLPVSHRCGNSLVEAVAALAQADLVIAVDTAHAHIGATLGLPTWILVAHAASQYWGLDGAHSPFYPTVRIFRQHSPRDWRGAVADIMEGLCHFAKAHPVRPSAITSPNSSVQADRSGKLPPSH